MTIDFVFQILILLISVVIHEVAHGATANSLGDPTAKYEGRLTLNPLKHLDIYGSLIVPTIAYFLSGFIIGWAKPVPYNPHNLRGGRWSEALVALAGPISNFSIALIFGLLLRFGAFDITNLPLMAIVSLIIYLNILLGVFNLVPIPPLDGSKILFAAISERTLEIREFFERFGFVLILLFIFFGWQFISPIVGVIFGLITGFRI